MALRLEQKKAIVAKVAEVAHKAASVVAVDYRGLTVEQVSKLRTEARKTGVHLQVVRNTLAIRAFKGTSFECLESSLTGPVMLAFSGEELGSSARLIRDFAKTNDKVKVKALSLSGQLLGPEQLDKVAKLPTRDEAISQLLSVMKAPISNLVKVLAYPHTTLVRTLSIIGEKKEAGEF
ncbi:MAG: 50S ribosomal protein L10 [Gammaproteobacteria bacterium]